MSMHDGVVIQKAKLKNLFTPDFWVALKSKGGAKHVENLIDDLKEELEKVLLKEINEGNSDNFESACNKTLKNMNDMITTLAEIENNNSLLELDEEDRFIEITKDIDDLKEFLKKKKINPEKTDLVKAIDGLEKYRAQLRRMTIDQAKYAYNVAHDHHSFARFLHVRGEHSVANHLKVVEKHIRGERSKEIDDFKSIGSAEKSVEKSDSMKDFESRAEQLVKTLKKYIGDGEKEFNDLIEANRMVALLLNFVIELLSKFENIIADARDKGYDQSKYEEFKKKMNEELEAEHKEAESYLGKTRAIMHKVGASGA